MPLLAPDEPSASRVLRPQGASDYVLTADHAGKLIPRALGTLGLPEAERSRHIAWDIGIAGTTERLSAALDAPAVLQTYSRLVIDCNRGHGIDSSIPTISETTEIPGNRNLAPEDRAARQREIFVPYHAQIRALLDARDKAGRRTVLVAMHSFTPVYKGEHRPMHCAVLYNRDRRIAHIMRDLFLAEGDLVVGDNEPYAMADDTDYGMPIHGERRGLAHVELEIRQDLIADETGQRAWADRLARLLRVADDKLRDARA